MHLVPYIKNHPISKISTSLVERYKKKRIDGGASPGTVNRELAVLSHLYTKAAEWKWVEHRPFKIERLKENPGKIVYLTAEQSKRLIEQSKKDPNPFIYPFVLIGLETSMRRMEILSIRIENIDLEKRIIYIPQAKAGSRSQPITANLAQFLKGLISLVSSDQEWLFPSAGSRTGHVVAIEKPFRRVVQEAGLNPHEIVRHTLRHTAVTLLVQAGVDLPTVQKISGHKTLEMVVRYSHQNGEHIQAAMDKLEKKYDI